MLSFMNLPMKVVGLLESNTSDSEIAAGVILGLFLGLTPLNGPMAILLAAFFFIFRLNRTSTLLTLPLFKLLYISGASGLCEKAGSFLLIDASALNGFWRVATHVPVIAYLDVNYTLVAGGLAVASTLSVPAFFISKSLAAFAKKRYAAKVARTRIAKVIAGLKLATKVDGLITTDSGISLNAANIKQTVVTTVKQKLAARKKAVRSAFARRVNMRNLVLIVVALLITHFGTALLASPFLAKLVVSSLNEYANTRISVGKIEAWPLTLSVTVKDVKVFNPDSDNERIISFDTASFGVSPIGLLSKRLIIRQLGISGAQITLAGEPDGTFTIQKLARPKGPSRPEGRGISLPAFAMAHRDWAGKVYGLLQKRFSRTAAEEAKTRRLAAKKTTKSVKEVDRGTRVSFTAMKDQYLFEIRKLSMPNARVTLDPGDGSVVEITPARIDMRNIAYDPDNGARLERFHIKGDVTSANAPVGGVELFFSRGDRRDVEEARYRLALRGLNLPSIRFLYASSLPVTVEKGAIDLVSDTVIADGEIVSHNSLSLKGHLLAPKPGNELAFGIVPMSALCDAMNKVSPLALKFDLAGPVENPKFVGFQESLMAIVKPYLADVKEKVIREGANLLQDFLKKNLGKTSENGQAQ